MKKMKRRCLFVVLALVVVFGSVSVASAFTHIGNINAARTSNTSASIRASIDYTETLTSCRCKLVLQEKYSGGWRTATGVSGTSATKTVYKTDSLSFSHTFKLVKGKVYRIKGTFTGTKGSTQNISTYYSSSF